MKESADLQGEKHRLENLKPELDERAKELEPLHRDLEGDLKRAFDHTKQIVAIREREAATDATGGVVDAGMMISKHMSDFKKIMKEVTKIAIEEYKPKRHALLLKINKLNDDIRRHNREIQSKQRQGKALSDDLKVEEYLREKVPGDIEHDLDLNNAIRRELWEKFPLQEQPTN